MINSTPLVSVIVPYYNSKEYMTECVYSIMAQTYKNLEILLIDNNSSDISISIARSLKDKDERIRLLHCTRQGLAASRNYGIEAAVGDWIFFVDSDDVLEKTAVEVLLDKALETDAEMVCGAHYVMTTIPGKVERNEELNRSTRKTKNIYTVSFSNKIMTEKEEFHDFFLNEGRASNQTWAKIYKRSVFEGIRYPERRLYEDIYIIPFLLEKVNKIACVNYPVYYYRQHPASITYSSNILHQMDGLFARIENASFYDEKYPVLSGAAYDCALEFAFFLMGRIKTLKIKNHPNEWRRLTTITWDLAMKAERRSFLTKAAVFAFSLSPRFAASIFALYTRIKNRI